MLKVILSATMLVALSLPVQARPRAAVGCSATFDIMRPCGYTARQAVASRPAITRSDSQIIGSRPAGCPRAYCGCGASLHLFGRNIPSLNLAANWFRFPRAAPAPKMAAVRRHHVFVLERHIAGNIWEVFDANSGGHATRRHARSISGYVIVNPTGA